MQRTRRPRDRRRTAPVAVVCAVIAGVLVAPTAAYAAGVDIEASMSPSVSGSAGEVVAVYAAILNNDPNSGSGPATIQFAAAGSTITDLVPTPAASCDIASATCLFADVAAYDSVNVTVVLQLGISGTLTATVSQAGGGADPQPANDSVASPVTVSAAPPPPPPPPPPPAPPAPAPAAVLTMTATPHPVRAGAAVHLSARLTSSAGAPLPNEAVSILEQAAGATTFSRVTDTYTDNSGVAKWDAFPTAATTFKAQFSGGFSATAGPAESPVVAVRVTFAVTAVMSPVTVPPGAVATLTIAVASGAAGSSITLQQQIGIGPWKSIGHPTLVKGGKAQLRITTLTKVGTYSFRATRSADATHDQGTALARVVVTTTGKGDKNAWIPLVGSKTRPSRWNPCAPIVYYVNPRHMPANGLADLREALRRVSIAGGLTFRYGGTQNVVPTPGYHGPASGILIAWATTAETKGLLPSFADGLGGGGRTFGRRIASGYVIIDARSVLPGQEPPGFGAGSPQGLVLMHELGHVVGLGHVDDRWSIMQPGSPLPASVWGAGDITGLRAVGRPAGCL